MFVAQKKRKENIVEYVLYMWNVEDLIRANELDMKKIDANIVSKYQVDDPALRQQIYDWWDNLCAMMKREGIEKQGHLQIITMLTNDIYNFHLYLLTQQSEKMAYANHGIGGVGKHCFALKFKQIVVVDGSDAQQHVLHLLATWNLGHESREVGPCCLKGVLIRYLALLSQKYLKAERELHPEQDVSENGEFVKPQS